MKRNAFTLIELLVVIAIVSVLMVLLVPAVQKAKDLAMALRCKNNLSQLAKAAHIYHSNYGRLPSGLNYPGQETNGWPAAPDKDHWYNLHVALFPYCDQQPIRDQLVTNMANNHTVNCNGPNTIGAKIIPLLVCPADVALAAKPVDTYGNLFFGIVSYGGCSGTSPTTTQGASSLKNGIFYMNSQVRLVKDIPDGEGNTFLLGERSHFGLQETSSSQALGGWAWANTNSQEDVTMNASKAIEGIASHDLNQFGSQHSGGSISHFAFADATVRTVRKSISVILLQRLATRNGNEVIDANSY